MAHKTLILLHGALGSEKYFDRLKMELEMDFDVRTFTFEGHGGVPLKGSFGMQTFVDNLLFFMDSEKIEKASLFGFSMGGYVALKFALLHSERVEKVITYGTKFNWTPEFAAAEVRKLNPEKIAEKVPQFANHLSKTHEPLDWKKVVSNTAQMMIDLGENNELQETDFRQIEHSSLILLGELDQMSTLEESQNVAELLQNGEFEQLSAFEHAIEKVDHELLAKRILGFLSE